MKLSEIVREYREAREISEVAEEDFIRGVIQELSWLLDLGYTYRQLAKLAVKPDGGHYSFQYLQQIREGTMPPTLAVAEALAKGLEKEKLIEAG